MLSCSARPASSKAEAHVLGPTVHEVPNEPAISTCARASRTTRRASIAAGPPWLAINVVRIPPLPIRTVRSRLRQSSPAAYRDERQWPIEILEENFNAARMPAAPSVLTILWRSSGINRRRRPNLWRVYPVNAGHIYGGLRPAKGLSRNERDGSARSNDW